MPKVKFPFKPHRLKPLRREEFTPAKVKPEGTDVKNRGYFPGSAYTPAGTSP